MYAKYKTINFNMKQQKQLNFMQHDLANFIFVFLLLTPRTLYYQVQKNLKYGSLIWQ